MMAHWKAYGKGNATIPIKPNYRYNESFIVEKLAKEKDVQNLVSA